jgi:hypothetical protein
MATPFRRSDALEILERMAAQLRLSVMTPQGESVAPEPYSPDQEVERSEEVDEVCARLAQEFAPHSCALSLQGAAIRMKPGIAELVLWRIEDARRHLQRLSTVQWPVKMKPALILHQLLIDSWHTYAEPFWLERVERAKSSADSPLQLQKTRATELTEVMSRYFDLSGC